MKRKMKRIFSLMLVLTMALGMMPIMSIKALATETITTLTLTGLTKPVAGEYPTIDGISLGDQVVLDEKYTRWLGWDGTDYMEEVDVTTPFEEGKKYALYIYADADSGYELASDLKVIYNGVEIPDYDSLLPYFRTDKIVYIEDRLLNIQVLAEDIPNPQYDITVTDGTAAVGTQAAATSEEGAVVTITADVPAKGKMFDKWEVVSGSVTFSDAASVTTTFTMPRGAISVKGTYKDEPQYDIIVTDGTATIGTETVTKSMKDKVITLIANNPASGKVFDKWEVVSGSVTFVDATSATTTFTMPESAVSIKAVYKDVNGWTTTENDQKVYYQNGNIAKSQWCQDGEKWYYVNEIGAPVTDWQQIGGTWYYFYSDGTMAASTWVGGSYVGTSGAWVENPLSEGWIQSGSKWWYQYPDGTYAQSTWKKIAGEWYYFDKDGWMSTGWTFDGSDWYYMNADGVMQTGWLKDGDTWYYLKSSGAMATGWVNDGGSWYFMDNSGAMKTGWNNQGEDWYYLDESGVMKTGWVDVDGTWYYLYESGAMAHDTVIDGYTLNENGAWVQ